MGQSDHETAPSQVVKARSPEPAAVADEEKTEVVPVVTASAPVEVSVAKKPKKKSMTVSP